jgi:hypothetical protein
VHHSDRLSRSAGNGIRQIKAIKRSKKEGGQQKQKRNTDIPSRENVRIEFRFLVCNQKLDTEEIVE